MGPTCAMRHQIKIPTIAAIALLAPLALAYFISAEQVTITVEDKGTERRERSSYTGNRRHVSYRDAFLVFTPDEVFEVSTSFVFLKFASAERYHSLESGRSYRAIVAGWRIPLLGQYRNIIEVLPGEAD